MENGHAETRPSMQASANPRVDAVSDWTGTYLDAVADLHVAILKKTLIIEEFGRRESGDVSELAILQAAGYVAMEDLQKARELMDLE